MVAENIRNMTDEQLIIACMDHPVSAANACRAFTKMTDNYEAMEEAYKSLNAILAIASE